MSAEIIQLSKEGKTITEGEMNKIQPEGINGIEIGLQYFLKDLGSESRHPGKLLVHKHGTFLSLFTHNWNRRTDLSDMDDSGKKQRIHHGWRYEGIRLRVIETDIWHGSIGVRIRHVASDTTAPIQQGLVLVDKQVPR
ncbi:hypothetical protein HYV64_01230 [Candidatus Shapirobacteria bacterium]|nr:hypothetical protein [Candidatus Shapirobacteria bacterium]